MKHLDRRTFIIGSLALGASAQAAPTILRAQAPTKLRFTNFADPTSFLSSGIFRLWFDRIQEAADGTIQIDMYDGGSLAAAPDVYDAVRKGIADLGWGVTGYTPGRFNAATVVELPFEAHSCASASAGLWAAYKADLLDGFRGAEILAVMSSGIQHVQATHQDAGRPCR